MTLILFIKVISTVYGIVMTVIPFIVLKTDSCQHICTDVQRFIILEY